jgi:hypothetical protein
LRAADVTSRAGSATPEGDDRNSSALRCEDRGVRADADRQRNDCRQREERIANEQTYRVPKILAHSP